MVQINSYEQFTELRNNAVRHKKLKLTNFLVPNDELKLHILNGRVFFEGTETCLCVVIKIRKFDYLYFWCVDEKDTFIPQGVNDIILTAFTNTEQNIDWSNTANRFDLKLKSKLLQIGGKVQEFTYPKYPVFLRSSFKVTIRDDYTYDYYAALAEQYFDFENDIFPEDYIWNGIFKGKLKLVEIRTNNGDLAAFYTFSVTRKSNEGYLMAVVPKYRGMGLQPLMLEETLQGYDYFKTWVQDWNSESWRGLSALGIKMTNNYRVLYGRPAMKSQ